MNPLFFTSIWAAVGLAVISILALINIILICLHLRDKKVIYVPDIETSYCQIKKFVLKHQQGNDFVYTESFSERPRIYCQVFKNKDLNIISQLTVKAVRVKNDEVQILTGRKEDELSEEDVKKCSGLCWINLTGAESNMVYNVWQLSKNLPVYCM